MIAVSMASSLIGAHTKQELILQWLPIFMLGILAHRYFIRHLSAKSLFISSLPLVATAAYVIGPKPTAIAVASVAVITIAPQIRCKPLETLGDYSYSLYLIHVPIAVAVLAVSYRLPATLLYHTIAQLIAVALIVLATYCLRVYVEIPAQLLAKRIQYGKNEVIGQVASLDQTLR